MTSEHNTKQNNTVEESVSSTRRNIIRSAGGLFVAGAALPTSWTKPVVDSVLLPAHAQTSAPTPALSSTDSVTEPEPAPEPQPEPEPAPEPEPEPEDPSGKGTGGSNDDPASCDVATDASCDDGKTDKPAEK